MKEALKLALEALNEWRVEWSPAFYEEEYDSDEPEENTRRTLVKSAITAIKEVLAQPEQKQNLKLMPREATPEMLKAMDECSTEGYDERLYAGHAGSVYMAAWDAFYGQHCYCGDITNLGVIHRDDGPCHYPDHKESKPEQEPRAWIHNFIDGGISIGKRPIDLDRHPDRWTALFPEPKPCPTCEALARTVMFDQTSHDTTPPQRKPLTDEEIGAILEGVNAYGTRLYTFARAIEAKLKEKNK